MALPRTGVDARTPADRRAARHLHALVCAARLDAARAPTRPAGARARWPLGAVDRADRRRQDARGVPADTGGVEWRPQARCTLSPNSGVTSPLEGEVGARRGPGGG